jgi:hypothetical protein
MGIFADNQVSQRNLSKQNEHFNTDNRAPAFPQRYVLRNSNDALFSLKIIYGVGQLKG